MCVDCGSGERMVVEREKGTLVVTVRITLQPGRDDDLIELVNTAPKGALAGVIREALSQTAYRPSPLLFSRN